MGACFSRSETEDPSPTAKVISVNGELHAYAVPMTVSRVLHLEAAPSSSGFFICNSDGLYYEEPIPPLIPGEELVENQIYFVLPESKLDGRLKAPEMAALAVKASLALRKAEEKGIYGGRRRRGKALMRISPLVEVPDEGSGYDDNTTVGMASGYFRDETVNDRRGRNGSDIGGNQRNVARSGLLRRTTRIASWKRAKFAVRSSRMRLNTIYEGTAM